MSSEWANMRDLGRLFGRTSHDVGRILKHEGYRTDDGKPAKKSFDAQLVREYWSNNYYSWTWNVDRTCVLLESFGWKQKCITAIEI